MDARFYLETRSSTPSGVLKLAFTAKRRTAYLSLGIHIPKSCWDAELCCVVNHPSKQVLNYRISELKKKVDTYLLYLDVSGEGVPEDPKAARDLVTKHLFPDRVDKEEAKVKQQQEDATLFVPRFIKYANTRPAPSTTGLYMQTLRRIQDFFGEEKLSKLHFEDITKEWLAEFEKFMARTAKKNARNVHLRNIRSVFNEAIDDEITSWYPFRRFKIRPEPTAKRSLSVEELRTIIQLEDMDPVLRPYRDMFLLSFYFIGINMVDLCNLKEIYHGRVEYNRAKTHHLYSIKVEPEAQELIDRYRGKEYLVNIRDTYNNHVYYIKRINSALKRLGPVERHGLGGKKYYTPLFPQLSTYWARYT
jgi:hypothetical protein